MNESSFIQGFFFCLFCFFVCFWEGKAVNQWKRREKELFYVRERLGEKDE